MSDNAQTNLDVLVNGVDNLSPALQQIESRVIRFVGAISASLAAIKAISFPIVQAAQFDLEMANVAKTTNFTQQQIAQLSEEILDLSLKLSVSAVDLAKVAAAGGQQGLGREGVQGVLEFTTSVARMANVLDLTADDAAVQIGKIANIFKLPFDQLERAVASFNQTSNNTTASGKELLDVVRRLGNASGTINLSQSIGLSAAAIDFGVSPEVAGSNLSRAFATMLSKADIFAKQMKTSTKSWTAEVQTDGVAAFKKVLDYLRTLSPDQQNAQIGKLFGGGARGGSLISKFVQDSSNAVLDRDLAQASTGFSQGSSALQEQATVQNTVANQSIILLNSIKKDAIEAGEQLTGVLINDIKELTAELQQPGVKSFINELVASLGDVISLVISVAKYVGSMNVNWENFVTVGKIFVELKLVEIFTGLLGKLTGVDSAIKSMAASSAAAATASGAAGKAATDAATQEASAWDKTKASVAALNDLYQQGVAQVKARQAAVADLARAEQNAADAAITSQQANSRVDRATNVVQARSVTTKTAKSTLATTQDAQAGDALATFATMNQKIEAAAVVHEQKLAEIETEYQNLRSQARALGRNKAGAQALADADEFLANMTTKENTRYERSIAGTQQYYGKLLTTQVESYAAQLDAQTTFLAEAEAKQAASQSRLNSLQATANVASTNKLESGIDVVQSRNAITAISQGAGAGTKALQFLVLGLNAVKNGLAALASFAAGAFFWVTIIYSIADAFGLIDGLGAGFAALTDKIGLTSAALRQQKVDQEAATEAMAKQTQKINEQIAAYDKLKDVQTGTYTKQLADAAAQRAFASSDRSTRDSGFQELLTAGAGAADQLNRTQSASDRFGGQDSAQAQNLVNDLTKQLADSKAQITTLQQQIAAAQATIDRVNTAPTTGNPYGGGADATALARAQSTINQATTDLASANAKVDDLTKKLNLATEALTGQFAPALDSTSQSAKNVAEAMATGFSQQSADIATKYIPDVIGALNDAQSAQDKYQASLDALKTAQNAKDDSAIKSAQSDVTLSQQALQDANAAVDVARQHLRDVIAQTAAANAGGDKNILNSIEFLNTLVGKSSEFLQTVLTNLNLVKQFGLQFTATAAQANNAPPSSGTGQANTQTQGQLNQLAKAQIKLQEATAQAAVNAQKELNNQLLAADEFGYNQGLTALEKYYADRQRIQLEDNANEIAAKNREIAAIEKESTTAQPGTGQAVEYQAQLVALRGQIKVLQEQQAGIQQKTQQDLTLAQQAFNDRVNAETVKAFQSQALPGDLTTQFKTALDSQLAQYRVFLAQLDSEAKQAIASGDTATAQRLATVSAAIKASLNEAAFNDALQSSNSAIEASTNALTQYQTKLNLLRGEGALTTQEAESAYNAAIKAQIPLLQQQLDMQTQLLSLQQQGTPEYQRQAQAVTETQLKIAQLGAQANTTARSINDGITSSLANALGNLKPTIASLKDAFLGFFRDVAQQMQQTFAKNFAERIINGSGTGGTGGIGGYFQSILQPGTQTQSGVGGILDAGKGLLGGTPGATPANPIYTRDATLGGLGLVGTGAATEPGTAGVGGGIFSGISSLFGFGGSKAPAPAGGVGGALGPAGSSPANPIYTRDAGNLFGSAGSSLFGDSGGQDSKQTTKAVDQITSAFSDNTDKQIDSNTATQTQSTQTLAGATGLVQGAVDGNTGQVVSGLITLGSQIVAALAEEALSNGASSAVAAAHTGGKLGSSSLSRRHVGAGAFIGAQRYHTGGVIGLRPNEMPIIANKGEEMLTPSDPRHRDNGGLGGAGSGGQPIQVSQTLLFDADVAAGAILTPNNIVTAVRPMVKTLRSLLGVKN